MNALTLTAAGLVIFMAMLVISLYVLRMLSIRYADSTLGQGLAAIVH